jgi:hypothetical protein
LRKVENALKGLGDFRSDGRTVEESENTFREERHVVVEGSLDVSFSVSVREGDETDFAGLGVDGGVSAFVKTLANVQEVIEGVDVSPGTTLAASGVGRSVGFDVEEMLREINFRTKDFDHLGHKFDVAFLGELAHKDTEGGGVATAATRIAAVTEGAGIAVATLPRDLTLVAVVGVRKNRFNRGENRNKGGSSDILSEGSVRRDAFVIQHVVATVVVVVFITLVLMNLLLLILFLKIHQIITLFRCRTRPDRFC